MVSGGGSVRYLTVSGVWGLRQTGVPVVSKPGCLARRRSSRFGLMATLAGLSTPSAPRKWTPTHGLALNRLVGEFRVPRFAAARWGDTPVGATAVARAGTGEL